VAELELVIRNGEIVTEAGSMVRADIGISGGVIVQIGGTLTGRQELDATGKLILPGGIDAHVHLSFPRSEHTQIGWVDDFSTGSAAALAGGITTLGNMTFLLPGETALGGLEREHWAG
jgi:dihydropyrimidinase